MLKMVKKLAKAFKGFTRPKKAKALPCRNVMPAQVAIQPMQTTVDAKLQAFLKAVEEYPCRVDIDEWLDADDNPAVPDEIENLVFAFEALLGTEWDAWMWGGIEYDALCVAVESSQACGEEVTGEAVAGIVESIADGDYTFLPEVYDDADLGSEILDRLSESGRVRDCEWILDYVDAESVGEAWRNDEGGCYTDRGYFQFGTIEF